MKIKIAIADDHPLVINGLRHVLSNNKDMEITGCYSNGAELLKGLVKVQPDVLLLDVQMPGQTGDQLAPIIGERYPTIKMLALTNLDSVYHIKNMLKNGVHGYVLKTAREEILLEAIKTVNKGEQYLESALKEKLVQDAFQIKKQHGVDPVLSRREIDVLKLIAQDLTSVEIGEKLCLSKRTVDNHRLSLLMKLDVKNAAALVKRGIQMGLIE